jgi:hypothetical protein
LTTKRKFGIKESLTTAGKEESMDAVLEVPWTRGVVREAPGAWQAEMATRVAAMGLRLRAAYLDGAIPYLREQEAELWAELGRLDEEDSPAALVAYERLFLEGLLRYGASLGG